MVIVEGNNQFMYKTKYLIYFFVMITCACCSTTIKELKSVGKLPEFAPSYMAVEPSEANAIPPPKASATAKYTNSLWQPGSRAFFRDRRTRNVGDILKVKIQIKNNANMDNKTTRNRNDQNNLAAPNIFGLESVIPQVFPSTVDLTKLLSLTGNNSNSGTGKIERKEDINTEIAAMVTNIFPNGSLMIQGTQEIRVNYELREITISGIIRPEDIGADNSISLDQIAEARLSYGGRGTLSRMQKLRYGNEVIDIMTPF